MTVFGEHRIFVLGLDGATFSLLEPMARAGVIPRIAGMLRDGARGPLRTIFPPVTAPAWLALATGLNPGKTGVYDYINRDGDHSTTLQPVSSADYAGRAVWDILGGSGRKVGIFNYPTLSPAPEVNGFSVTGMGGYRHQRSCYPETLAEELHRVSGGYESALNLRNPAYERDAELFFRDIGRILSKQSAAMLHLTRTHGWDFFFGVLSVTDWMQHVLWKHLDPSHPQHDPASAARVQQGFREVWARIDALVGEIGEAVPPGTNLIIVSDHGAGALDSVFYPNVWLERRGWLARKRSWKARAASWVDLFSEGSDTKYAHRLKGLVRERVLRIGSSVDLIDFSRSLAYSPEHNTMFGCLNLTGAGRGRAGFREEIVEALRRLPGEVPGVGSVEVMLPEQLYEGPYVDRAPDILFVVNGYRSTVEIGFASGVFGSKASIGLRTGSHRSDGVFIASGPAFRAVGLDGPSILDIAPTVLALQGQPIPAAMDGAVLTEALDAHVLESLTIRRAEAVAGETAPANREEKPGDMEEMKGILKSLGYM